MRPTVRAALVGVVLLPLALWVAAPGREARAQTTSSSGRPAASSVASQSPLASSSAVSVPAASESPEQRRKDFVERARIQIRAAVSANRREVTEEERETIRGYWRHAMRLLRIRELAEQANDADGAARADKLLERFGKRFYEETRILNAKAPLKNAAPGTLPRPVSTTGGAGTE